MKGVDIMDKVIAMFEAEDKIYFDGIHEFLKKYDGYRLVICNVTEDEFNCMEDQIKSGLKRLYERLNSIQNIGYDKSRVIGYYDTDMMQLKFINPEIEQINLESDEFKNTMKVYTTVSYHELNKSYGNNEDEVVTNYIKIKRNLPRYHRLPISKIN